MLTPPQQQRQHQLRSPHTTAPDHSSAPQHPTPQEGKEKAEEVMTRLREAGLTLRVRKHLGKVTAATAPCRVTTDTWTLLWWW